MDEDTIPPPGDGLMALADGLAQAIEIAAGHRERCIAQGFSPTMAEQMAFSVHQGLMMRMFSHGG